MVSICTVCAKMEWTNEKVLRFLDLYQMHPCIWDPKNGCHKVKAKVNDAWIEIKNNMGEPTCTVKELKKKKDSLMSMYRGYKTKVKKSEVSGAGASEVFNPSWFAYEFMDTFLSGIYKCNASINTEDNNNAEQNATQTDDTNDDNDTPTLEEERQGSSSSQWPHQTPTATIFRKRQRNPPELQQAKTQMDQAFNLLQNVAQPKHCEEEDECSIFGRLVAKKISRLSEDRRDLMMIKINQLFYDERLEQERNRQNYSSPVQSYSYTPSPQPIIQTQQENIMPQIVTTRQTTLTGTSMGVTPQQESSDIDNFDYMNSEVDPTAAQPSNIISVYQGPASDLNQFVIFKPKH